MVKHHILIGFVLALVATCPALSWADFAAKVVTVHEGDRLTIRHDGQSETIYLKDIDCPELKQPYGKQAKHAIAAYVGEPRSSRARAHARQAGSGVCRGVAA
jgi:endonuclease YncB( thermonuclease family)